MNQIYLVTAASSAAVVFVICKLAKGRAHVRKSKNINATAASQKTAQSPAA
ncbi:hypothetical protein [Pseudoalteromonas sp. MMG005]|uniref:hypothetical protein n=1 Tax=Pseudoalteromonas sp. MMG005 TaxID=2822682 RepID=UPI001B3A6701|nr:hypothetical protein [Pseudoalteromonas sp. MMG005]